MSARDGVISARDMFAKVSVVMRGLCRCGMAAGVAVVLLAAGQPAWAGDLRVESRWARATAGRVETGAAYMVLIGGEQDDTLIGASSPAAEAVELHTHLETDGVMRMRQVAAIPIPAKAQVVFRPGGLHIMLIGLKGPLKEGRTFSLTLTFARAGRIETEIPILAPGARGGG